MYVQRRRARDDDEPGNHVGKNAARDYIPARSLQAAARDALFHDR